MPFICRAISKFWGELTTLGAACTAYYIRGPLCQGVVLYQKSRVASAPPSPPAEPDSWRGGCFSACEQIVMGMAGRARAIGQRWWGNGGSSCWLIKDTRVKSGPHQARPYAQMQTTAACLRIAPLNRDFSCCSVPCFGVLLRRCPVGQASGKRSRIFSLASTFLSLHCRRRGEGEEREQMNKKTEPFVIPLPGTLTVFT